MIQTIHLFRAILIVFGTIAIVAVVTAFLVGIFGVDRIRGLFSPKSQQQNEITVNNQVTGSFDNTNQNNQSNNQNIINIPIDNALSRITKKPFGIEITPQNSPIQPEKFSGFHTGADFEIFDNELNTDVKVKAICDGDIIQKTTVSGYGGVIIQKCQYRDEPVLILYGHIDPATFTKKTQIKKGDKIASLSPDNSPGSGYERKHLHLGIIKGNKIDYRGYVQYENELSNWIDPVKLLK